MRGYFSEEVSPGDSGNNLWSQKMLAQFSLPFIFSHENSTVRTTLEIIQVF